MGKHHELSEEKLLYLARLLAEQRNREIVRYRFVPLDEDEHAPKEEAGWVYTESVKNAALRWTPVSGATAVGQAQ